MATKGIWFGGIIVGALVTGAVALGGWNLKETASVPKIYATKIELKEIKEDIEKDQDALKQDVKDGFKNIMTEQRYIKEAVDEINRHLRDMNGG